MRKIKAILLILFFFIIYIYVCNITLLPSNFVVFEGEEINLKTVYGIKVNTKNTNLNQYDVMQTATNLSEKVSNNVGTVNLSLDLFGTIPLKEIDVNILPRTMVVPLGNSIGMKLYTDGVLVVGMSEIIGEDNINYKPYENSGIEEGDRIIEVNNVAVKNTAELIKTINKSKGDEIEIVYIRDKDEIRTSILPVKTSNNEYKLGLWVRDAAAGVGTATFYEPSTGMFAALGHGIVDIDTGNIVNIANGELTTSSIVAIKKGEKGNPGEIRGTIESGLKVGEIYKNGNFGICGTITNKENLNLSSLEEMEVALRSEIEEGRAYIMCELENGKVDKYEIEIKKVYTSNNYDNKSMLIKVTDSRLLEKTGGIIQGMSGSPIIQNGRFIGAVTHVLIQDPTQGYGVFADMMIKQMRE
ncbi:MAG: SpoIVB peptidase [Clostridia bacterium]|nr:SpoIVB peptidase [Clostridia bacterium]